MDIKKPEVFSSRDNHVKTDKYLFISYSHKDVGFVYPVLNDLFDKGLNFWYDSEIESGTSWSETAKEAMKDENCLGIIFFLSENSVLSPSIAQEIEFAKQKNNCYMVPVVINANSYYQLVQKAFISLKDVSATDLANLLPLERIDAFMDYFKEEILFLSIKSMSDGSLVDRIIKEATAFNHNLISTSNSAIQTLFDEGLVEQRGAEVVFPFSRFPSVLSSENTLQKEGFFKLNGEQYFKANNRVYRCDLLYWTVLNVSGEMIKAVSQQYLDACYANKIDFIVERINVVLNNYSHDIPVEAKIPTVEEIKTYHSKLSVSEMSPFLRRELGEEVRLTGFWAKDDNGKYVIINEEGNVVSDNQVSSGAIKLLMEIHKDALISFFEEEF